MLALKVKFLVHFGSSAWTPPETPFSQATCIIPQASPCRGQPQFSLWSWAPPLVAQPLASLESGPGHAALQLPVDASPPPEWELKEDRDGVSQSRLLLCLNSARSSYPCYFHNRMDQEPGLIM